MLCLLVFTWLQSNLSSFELCDAPDGKLFEDFFTKIWKKKLLNNFPLLEEGGALLDPSFIKSEAFKRNEQAFGKKTVKLFKDENWW